MPPHSFRDILKAAFSERLSRNPRYSLRSFARDLGVSPAGISQILNGKQGMTQAKALEVAQRLGLSEAERHRFKDLVAIEHSRSGPERQKAQIRLRAASETSQITLDAFQVVSDWYHFAILELISVKGFEPSAKWVAKALGISVQTAKLAVERLVRLELLEIVEDGSWRATDDYTLVPGGLPSDIIKKFHRQVIEQAMSALVTQPVENRNYSSSVLAIRKSDLPKARERIKEFRFQLMREMGQAPEKDSVYCLSTQFFEVTSGRPVNTPSS